ncbi:MAG: hypothetical protein LH615_13305 [Ferruginibacter sp.]|nr:hypothetical protein [Ferruginibacter sp.]
MDCLKGYALLLSIKFTVDSENAVEMENAAVRFCYAEDSYATLIRLVKYTVFLSLKNLIGS